MKLLSCLNHDYHVLSAHISQVLPSQLCEGSVEEFGPIQEAELVRHLGHSERLQTVDVFWPEGWKVLDRMKTTKIIGCTLP